MTVGPLGLAVAASWCGWWLDPRAGGGSTERDLRDLLQEAVDVHDDPGHPADGDEATLVADRDREGDPPAVHLLDRRLGSHRVADSRGREVVELDLHPHTGLS